MRKQNVKKGLVPYLFLFIAIIGIVYAFNILNQKVTIMNYGEFNKLINNGDIKEITIIPRDRAKVYEIRGKLNKDADNESFFVRAPLSDKIVTMIIEKQEEFNFKLKTDQDPESSSILLVLINVLPTLLLIGAIFFILTRQLSGANKSMDFGRSRAKLNEDNKKVNFDNVAGLKEEKEESRKACVLGLKYSLIHLKFGGLILKRYANMRIFLQILQKNKDYLPGCERT